MSIATRTGDEGTTGLMFGRRISKTDPRVEAYGTVDELSSFLGMARATAADAYIQKQILATQKDLVALMGEMAVLPEDAERYTKGKYSSIDASMLKRLDDAVAHLESKGLRFEGWATPGATMHAAALDISRTVCRRAERQILRLMANGVPVRPIIIQYLNRLSDVLWLIARLEENHALGEKRTEDPTLDV